MTSRKKEGLSRSVFYWGKGHMIEGHDLLVGVC